MICIATHHKCASSALRAYIEKMCKINNLSLYATHHGSISPPEGYDVCLLTNAEYYVIRKSKQEIFHFIRNPFNIVQSAYYSHRNVHPSDEWPQLKRQRQDLLKLDMEEGMWRTALFCSQSEFYPNTSGPLFALNSWDYSDYRIRTIRIEDCFDRFSDSLKKEFGSLLPSTMRWPDQEEFTFKKLSSGREVGDVNNESHYRSGWIDAWKFELPLSVMRYVVRECTEVLERFYPESLVWALGKLNEVEGGWEKTDIGPR